MGIEENQRKAQEDATKARKDLKAKVDKWSWRVLIILLIVTTAIWYFFLGE
jgi:hypothetical protein